MTAFAGTVCTATACIGPWGDDLAAFERWIASGETAPAQVREPSGFIASRFSPLVYTAASRCLDAAGAAPDGARTGVVLASVLGDTTTADVASRNLAEGRVHNPLLFYQSVPTSILGYLGRERGIRGPLACISAGADAAERARELAELMVAAGDADAVLVLYVELRLEARGRRLHDALHDGPLGALGCEDDVVVGLLLRRADGSPGRAREDDETTAALDGAMLDLPETDATRRLGSAAWRFLAWARRANRTLTRAPAATTGPKRAARPA
jgi:hypothetical protein